MIPLPPFDGGRVTAVLSPRRWLFGVPILIIMAIFALLRVWRILGKDTDNMEDKDYYVSNIETKVMYGIFYIGLIIFLVVMAEGVHEMLEALCATQGTRF